MQTTHIKFGLSVGKDKDAIDITNNLGRIKAGFVTIANESSLPNDIVRVALTDLNSKPYVEMDIREWKRRSGGDFYSSMVPLELNDSNLKLQINTATAPTSDLVMELVLVHEDENSIPCANHRY